MTDPNQPPATPPTSPMAFAGIGLELLVSVMLFFFLGYKLDAWWGTKPWMMLVGALLGMTVGFYGMFRRLLPSRGRKGRSS